MDSRKAARAALLVAKDPYKRAKKVVPTTGRYAYGGRTKENDNIWWHGSPSGDLRGGSNGLHLGTKAAAEDALHARIGFPAEGSWDGTRKYGETKLAGKKNLRARGPYLLSGHNADAPEDDYYAHEHPKGLPKYGDMSRISPDATPSIRPYRIKGGMTNSPWRPHDDFKANGYMSAALKRGNAKNGYYYGNVGEDNGSISAVVPSAAHIEPVDDTPEKAHGGATSDVWDRFHKAVAYARGGRAEIDDKLLGALKRPGSGYVPAKNKPATVKIPGYGEVEARPIDAIESKAAKYMKDRGTYIDNEFSPFNEDFARRVAEAFERMEHNPRDPKVKRAYDALIDETLQQYHAARDTGIDFKFLKPGEKDPYAKSPSLGYADIVNNGKLHVYPTDAGFGSSAKDVSDNPLLKRVGKIGDMQNATVNDAFRIVHDVFGHYGPGNPFFRAPGEERAFRQHAQMYGPEARKAAATETRGQNSWVNYGPYGDKNRKALAGDTVFADQKTGLMPDEFAISDTPIAKADGGSLSVVSDEHPVVQQAKQVLADVPKIVTPKVDPMAAVHALSTTPQDQAEQVMQANAERGLKFPQDASANRLRMKLARHKKAAEKGDDLPGMPTNPRTVVKAPEGLPDFVVGRVTPEDWVSRHEKILSPDEIKNSAGWYGKIYDNFLQQTKGDEEQAKKYMRGWLVAQQNVDVSGAMNNVLLQNEQMKRGVPESEMRAAGMPNPTAAARSVLANKPITGVGQKIADFVDAAEGKDVRSWMANHPDGGKPFVVDVHTGRDTGLVDQELLNHLTRLGYDVKAIKKLKVDMHASPSETQYENRAHFGHELTDHLNRIGWQGRSDWTPSEVQAVGWMGMTKLTANQADDVVSGLDRNTRRLSMELAPGEGSPWHKKYGDAFAKLAPADQYELTHHMTQKAIEHASKLAGIDVRDIVHGTGGWQQYQNPSTVGQALATKEGAEIAANALGHMLQQTEVWSNSVKPVTANPKGFAVDFIADGDHNLHTDEGLRDFWNKIMDADPLKGTPKALFQGYQPIRTVDGKIGIRALIDRGGVGTKKVLNDAVEGPIRSMVESLPFDVHAKMHEAEITKARNDWNEDKHGQAYKSRLVDLLKRDPAADLGRAGQELEEEFAKKLSEKARLTTGRDAQLPKARGGSVNHAPTDAQKSAGNYAKRKMSFQGIPITIENELGSTRSGRDDRGRTWSCKLPADYGYIRGTEGADGDHVDCYVGPDDGSHLVVVVNQRHLGGSFDEHKCLLGFKSEQAALDCYVKAFSDGKGPDRIKSVEVMSVDAFKKWLRRGKTTAPANGRSIVDRALQLVHKGASAP